MPLCMRFWTHMFGNGIGTLSIHLQDTRDSTEQQIWSLTGEAGNAWYQAEVPVSSANTFKVLRDVQAFEIQGALNVPLPLTFEQIKLDNWATGHVYEYMT